MLRESEDKLRAFMQLNASDDEGFADYLDALWSHRWIVVAIALAITILGTTYAFVWPPTYRADFAIQVEQPNPVSSGAQTLLGENLSGFLGISSQATTEIEILQSRLVIGQMVDDLRLYITAEPLRFPLLGRYISTSAKRGQIGKPWFGLKSFAWGGEQIKVEQFEVPPALYDEKWTLIAGRTGSYQLFFDGSLVLNGTVGALETANTEAGTVAIKVDTLVGASGTRFRVVRHERLDTIEKLSKDLKIEERSKDSGVVGVTLEGKDPGEIAGVLNRMAKIYLRQNADRKAAEAENMIDFLEGQLPSIKLQLDESERAYNSFRKQHGVLDLGEESTLLLKRSVESQTQLLELQQRRVALLSRFGAKAPDVSALDAQIDTLKDGIASSNGRIKQLPENQQEVVGLMRDVQVNTQLYTNLLNNLEQLRVVKAGKIGSVRVIDYAVTPYFPVKPNKVLVIPLSVVVGMILGIAAAFAYYGMVRGVEDPDMVESQLGLPVYATVPHSKNDSGAKALLRRGKLDQCLAYETPGDPAVESIRSLTTALRFTMLDCRNNIIMIAGAAPSVGKSFVALNMAALLGGMNKRVLLVDADLRRGYLHRPFGLARERGVSEVITGQLTAQQAIHREVGPGLDFLATGEIPPSPAELLLHPAFDRLLNEVSQNYDVVIIDTPPVLAVTDAAIVGRLAGAALLVLRFGMHPVQEIETTVKRLAQAGVNLKGAVFNNIPVRSSRLRYGRYKYSYQYVYDEKNE
jgi:tyrosine-protein kinase Etk/Wzc